MMSTFLFVLVLIFVFMVSLWLIDISVCGILNNVMLKGMFFEANPYFTYHVGLALATISFILLLIYLFYVKFEEFRKDIQNYFNE